ncbi:MAG: hypothetical protein ACC653_02565 [Gammaproteobacteria bacterium]
MISVGADVGGPECDFMLSHIRFFMKFCKSKRLDDASGNAKVNVVYILPGSIHKPDFVGLRTDKFSLSEKTLMVQASVEDELVKSVDDNVVLKYIFDVADEAIGIAKSYFDKKGVEYDLERDRTMLDMWFDSSGDSSGSDQDK